MENVSFFSAKCISINPPPPRLPAEGFTTARANATATAASIAFPPSSKTFIPISVARWCLDATAYDSVLVIEEYESNRIKKKAITRYLEI